MISKKAILQGLVLLTASAAALTSSAQYAYLPVVPTVYPAFELRESQIQSWAEYQSTDGTFPSKQRLALVGRGPTGYLLEVRIESPAFKERLLVRLELPAGAMKVAPQPWVDVMIGQRTPMRIRMPPSSPSPGFLDSKALVGKERIAVKGHIFTTTHYRNELGGDFFDYWVSAEAPPLGYVLSVKKEGTIVSRMELLNIGNGARPEMTQDPRDVDAAEFGHELQRNMKKQ